MLVETGKKNAEQEKGFLYGFQAFKRILKR